MQATLVVLLLIVMLLVDSTSAAALFRGERHEPTATPTGTIHSHCCC